MDPKASPPASRPVLRTARLHLRPWTLEAADVAAFHAIWGDPRVLYWAPSESLEESRGILAERLNLVEGMPAGMAYWAVALADGAGAAHGPDAIVGNVALRPSQYDQTAEIVYQQRHSAWGKGYITEAAAGVLRHGFTHLDLPVISGIVRLDNPNSHRVMERLGLRATGTVIHRGMPHTRYEHTHRSAPDQPWWASALREG